MPHLLRAWSFCLLSIPLFLTALCQAGEAFYLLNPYQGGDSAPITHTAARSELKQERPAFVSLPPVACSTFPSPETPGLPGGVQETADPLASASWLKHPVAFTLDNYPLAKLLKEFTARQGVGSQISDNLDGSVSGSFTFQDPREFLAILAATQHFNWYFDGGIVHYFNENEMTSRLLALEGVSPDALKRSLTALGLFEPRFVWKVADSGRLLMIGGPKAYLDRIQEVFERLTVSHAASRQQAEAETAKQLAEAAAAEARQAAEEAKAAAARKTATSVKKLGVFRLRHAWAAERTITSGDAETSVPGVADLLTQILSGVAGSSSATAGGRRTPTPLGLPRFNKGEGLVARQKQKAEAQAEAVETPESPEEVPFIKADSRLNAVLVWDTEENLKRYGEIIDTLDQPLELVEIRAAIVDVEVNRSRELGVSWEYKSSGDWQNDAGSNVGSGDKRVTYDSIAGDGFQYATIFTKGLDQFMARVSAMVSQGEANILSRPSVLTQENIQATLEHTETFYVRLEGEREVDLADITTGLTLRVTPHIVREKDGTQAIQLAVYIVNGTDDYDSSTQVDNLPRVRQSTISTNAVVFEGEALVIGGYYNEIRQASEKGIPGLRKIPGLGALFRTRSKTGNKSERLFVLSPRLVRPGDSPMACGSEGERVMTDSPGKKMLDQPELKDVAPSEFYEGEIKKEAKEKKKRRVRGSRF